MKRKSMATTLAIALSTSAITLIATPAMAAQGAYDNFDGTTQASTSPNDALVGTGSDTTQIVVHEVAKDWNNNIGGTHARKLSSFGAEPVEQIFLKQNNPTKINRPTGSSAGVALLGTDANNRGNASVSFARSSRELRNTEPNFLKAAAFASDGLKMAVANTVTSNAPASLTNEDVMKIYRGDYTTWNQIPGNSGGSSAQIKALYPKSNSGTEAFFKAELLALCGSTCAGTWTYGGNAKDTYDHDNDPNTPAQTVVEHSDAFIKGDPNVIAPFSTARAKGLTTIKILTGASWERAVYNVVRSADLDPQAATYDALLDEVFGPNGYFCSSDGRAAIERAGFVPLATSAQTTASGTGKCGVWTTGKVTDLTSFANAGTTTTTLTATQPNDPNKADTLHPVTLKASIGAPSTAGTVTFSENGTTIGEPVAVNDLDQATLALTNVTAGTHTYTATFASSDPQKYAPSSAQITVVVKKSAYITSLTVSPTSQYYGRLVTIKANVTADGAPAVGSVQFKRGTTVLKTVALSNGAASLTNYTSPVGTNTITATFIATSTTAGFARTASLKILRAPSITTGKMYDSTISTATYPIVMSQVTISGGVAGLYPTGSVRVYKGTTILGTKALSSGKANLQLAKLPRGTHTLRVAYLGSTNVSPSTSTNFTVTVS